MQSDRPVDAEESLDLAVGLLQPLVDAGGAEAADRRRPGPRFPEPRPGACAANQLDRAEADSHSAINLLTALAQEDADNPNYRHEEGVALNNLGNLLAEQGRWDGARNAHSDARALFLDLTRDFPRIAAYREGLANTLNSYGKALADTDGLDAADAAWAEARRQLERLIADPQADTTTYRGYLGLTLGNQGWSLAKREKWREARPLLEQAVADLAAARQAQPRNPMFRDGLAEHYRSLAETLLQSGGAHCRGGSGAGDTRGSTPVPARTSTWRRVFWPAARRRRRTTADCRKRSGRAWPDPTPTNLCNG